MDGNAITPADLRLQLYKKVKQHPCLVCRDCDADFCGKIADAKRVGWTDILAEEWTEWWTHTGLCSDCRNCHD